MGFEISVVEEDYSGNEDRRWLGVRMGAENNRSITLLPSLFLPAHVAGKGALPSGIILAKRTGTTPIVYGPYDPSGAAFTGSDVAEFLLFNTTKLSKNPAGLDLATAPKVGVPGFWGPGIVKVAHLPSFSGTVLGELDADARADMKFIRWED